MKAKGIRAVLGALMGLTLVMGSAQVVNAAETHSNCIVFDTSGNPVSFTPNCTQTMTSVGGDPQTMPVVNPCTGDPGILTQTPGRSVYHITVNGAGDAWDTGTTQGTVTFTPTDPSAPTAAGPFATWFGDELNAQNMVQHFTFDATLHVSNGQTVKAHIQAQMTFTPNGPVVDSFVQNVRCV